MFEKEPLLETEIEKRWREKTHCDYCFDGWEWEHLDLPWIPYEDFMEAQLLHAMPGEVGKIRVRFPAGKIEGNRMHIHPLSARVVVVLEGGGVFHSAGRGHLDKLRLTPGNRIWMPRGILHTFVAGPEGLLVDSFHIPWIPLGDPQCLTYPVE